MLDGLTKVALITGANKGIGLEIARQLGEAGCVVLMGAREASRGSEAAVQLKAQGLEASAIAVDLLDSASLARAAETIERRFGRLDILVNNAGITVPGDGPPGSADLLAIESTFKTNFFGTLAVTQAMLPLLRKAAAARIVNVSSGLGSLTQNADPDWIFGAVKYLGYNGSKAALNMMTVQLAYELKETKIKVNSADPGYTATDLNQHRGHQTVEQGAAEAVRLALLPEDGPTGTFSDASGVVPW